MVLEVTVRDAASSALRSVRQVVLIAEAADTGVSHSFLLSAKSTGRYELMLVRLPPLSPFFCLAWRG